MNGEIEDHTSVKIPVAIVKRRKATKNGVTEVVALEKLMDTIITTKLPKPEHNIAVAYAIEQFKALGISLAITDDQFNFLKKENERLNSGVSKDSEHTESDEGATSRDNELVA